MSKRQFPKLKPNLWDGLAAVLVLLLAAACAAVIWFQGAGAASEDLVAVISVDGVETERLVLENGERTVEAGGYTLHITLTETTVVVDRADCPTQDCVHTGRISRSGQSIVCLPARVVIQLTGGTPEQSDGVDMVLG